MDDSSPHVNNAIENWVDSDAARELFADLETVTNKKRNLTRTIPQTYIVIREATLAATAAANSIVVTKVYAHLVEWFASDLCGLKYGDRSCRSLTFKKLAEEVGCSVSAAQNAIEWLMQPHSGKRRRRVKPLGAPGPGTRQAFEDTVGQGLIELAEHNLRTGQFIVMLPMLLPMRISASRDNKRKGFKDRHAWGLRVLDWIQLIVKDHTESLVLSQLLWYIQNRKYQEDIDGIQWTTIGTRRLARDIHLSKTAFDEDKQEKVEKGHSIVQEAVRRLIKKRLLLVREVKGLGRKRNVQPAKYLRINTSVLAGRMAETKDQMRNLALSKARKKSRNSREQSNSVRKPRGPSNPRSPIAEWRPAVQTAPDARAPDSISGNRVHEAPHIIPADPTSKLKAAQLFKGVSTVTFERLSPETEEETQSTEEEFQRRMLRSQDAPNGDLFGSYLQRAADTATG